MDQRRDVEAWADAFLAEHRTAPPDTPPLEDDPVIEHLLQRAERHRALQRRFASLEAITTLVGVVLLCIFALAFHGGF